MVCEAKKTGDEKVARWMSKQPREEEVQSTNSLSLSVPVSINCSVLGLRLLPLVYVRKLSRRRLEKNGWYVRKDCADEAKSRKVCPDIEHGKLG